MNDNEQRRIIKPEFIELDLVITRMQKRNTSADGTWVSGKVNNEYQFQALVFAEHAEVETYELGRSKISKLWILRLADNVTVFNFDRGLDVTSDDPTTQVIADFLCAGLADLVYGK